MTRFRLFILSFAVSIVALICFFTTYISGMMNIMRLVRFNENVPPDPFRVFHLFFSPVLLISLVFLIVAGLVYRVLGIMFIARNTKLQGGEQALWIIGFVLFGFITAIVFMAMCKSRNLITAPGNDVKH